MELIDLRKIHEGEYVARYDAKYINKTGGTKVYELVSHNKDLTKDNFGNKDKQLSEIKVEAVGIIAFNQDFTKILLQKEFRLACNDWVYNFPGGMVDAGETIDITATRELKEETGLDVIRILDYMPPCYSAVGFTDETIATVICVAKGEFSESTSPDEEIEVGWYTKEEIREMLKTCKMSMRTQSFLYCWVHKYDHSSWREEQL